MGCAEEFAVTVIYDFAHCIKSRAVNTIINKRALKKNNALTALVKRYVYVVHFAHGTPANLIMLQPVKCPIRPTDFARVRLFVCLSDISSLPPNSTTKRRKKPQLM